MLTAALFGDGATVSHLAFYHNLEARFFASCLVSITSSLLRRTKIIFLHRETKVIFQKVFKMEDDFKKMIVSFFVHQTPTAFHCPNALIPPFAVGFLMISPNWYQSCCLSYLATWTFATAQHCIRLFHPGTQHRPFPSVWNPPSHSILANYQRELQHHFYLHTFLDSHLYHICLSSLSKSFIRNLKLSITAPVNIF